MATSEYGEGSLNDFHKFANSIHQNIKVEPRHSRESIDFLDTMVILEKGQIITNLYTKPTDKHIYVDRNLAILWV